MKWLKYSAYLGYLSYVYAIVSAVTQFVRDRDEPRMATEVANVLYNAVDYATKGKASLRVERNSVITAVRSVTDLYLDALE